MKKKTNKERILLLHKAICQCKVCQGKTERPLCPSCEILENLIIELNMEEKPKEEKAS